MEQNVHKKFTDRQNELRLFVINFIVDEGRSFNLESDKECALKALSMDEQEYEEIASVLLEKDGMVISDAKDVNFIYPV